MVAATYDDGFEVLENIGSGIVRRHFLVDINANDYKYIEDIASEKAKQGMQVDIMPTLGDVNDPLRDIIFPDAKYAKSPDLRINGELWEVEQPTKNKLNTVKHSVDEGAGQANLVIINLIHEANKNFMNRIAIGRFIDHKDLQVIEFRYNGKYTFFSRGQKKR